MLAPAVRLLLSKLLLGNQQNQKAITFRLTQYTNIIEFCKYDLFIFDYKTR